MDRKLFIKNIGLGSLSLMVSLHANALIPYSSSKKNVLDNFDVEESSKNLPVKTSNLQVLAIGKFISYPSSDYAGYKKVLMETVNLYFHNKITSFYSTKDEQGFIFLMNSDSLESIKLILDEFSFVKDGFIEFNLIPMSPLIPLEILFSAQ